MANMKIWERAGALEDIQRTFQWELVIPDIRSLVADVDVEALVIRARTSTIPGRTVEAIESYFGPTKQMFPGRITFTNTFNVTFEETQDQLISKTLYAWQERVMSIRDGSPNAGFSEVLRKRDLCTNIELYPYNYGGDRKLEKKFVFHNAWLSGFDDISLEYATGDSVKFNATFTFDYWDLVDSA